jgi:hypothetical protein
MSVHQSFCRNPLIGDRDSGRSNFMRDLRFFGRASESKPNSWMARGMEMTMIGRTDQTGWAASWGVWSVVMVVVVGNCEGGAGQGRELWAG